MIVHMPETMQEALALKARYGGDAFVLAGGQSLVVLMQHRLVQPGSVISLQRIPGLGNIEVDGQGVRLGAMVTIAQASRDRELARAAPILSRVCGTVASPHVRNVGTVVGNICHAEVGADPPQALLLLDAEVRAAREGGSRWIPVQEFFSGYIQTALEEDEIVTGVRFPALPASASHYAKFRRRDMDLAVTGVGVMALPRGNGRLGLRISAGGIGPRPLRARRTEESASEITPEELRTRTLDLAAQAASELSPRLSDVYASSAYRAKLVEVGVRRGIERTLAELEARS